MDATAASAVLQSTPLPELIANSSAFGQWTLKVATEPHEEEYTYKLKGESRTGKTFSITLVSEDASQYCSGKFQRRGKEPAASEAFNAAKKNLRRDQYGFSQK